MEPEEIVRIQEALRPENLGGAQSHDVYLWLLGVALFGMNMRMATPQDSGEIRMLTQLRQELLRRRLAPPYVMFDVGASVGEISVAFREVFGDIGFIHAFEPSTAAFDLISARMAELGWDDVFLNKVALGDTQTEATLFAQSAGHQTGSLYHRHTDELENAGALSEPVRVRTIDDYCLGAGVERIHFLKIDVEGHELAVLRGGINTLKAGAIDFIQFEFGSTNIDSRTYFRDFWNLLSPQYVIMRILRDGLVVIPQYDPRLEIFEWQNFLAARRL